MVHLLKLIQFSVVCFVLLALILLNIKLAKRYKQPDYVILTHSESCHLQAVPKEFI